MTTKLDPLHDHTRGAEPLTGDLGNYAVVGLVGAMCVVVSIASGAAWDTGATVGLAMFLFGLLGALKGRLRGCRASEPMPLAVVIARVRALRAGRRRPAA